MTPIIDGSAKGLRNKPCIAAPDIAKPAPTSHANNVRGNRISVIIICKPANEGSSIAVSVNRLGSKCNNCCALIDTGPTLKPSKRIKGVSNISAQPTHPKNWTVLACRGNGLLFNDKLFKKDTIKNQHLYAL